MTQTPNFQLNQWSGTDYVRRTDFNADNLKIDAALGGLLGLHGLKIVTGSYTGTGAKGSQNPNTITFTERPTFVLLIGDCMVTIPGLKDSGAASPVSQDSDFSLYTWTGNTLSWYAERAMPQMNREGDVYHYIAVYLN